MLKLVDKLTTVLQLSHGIKAIQLETTFNSFGTKYYTEHPEEFIRFTFKFFRSISEEFVTILSPVWTKRELVK